MFYRPVVGLGCKQCFLIVKHLSFLEMFYRSKTWFESQNL